jgi:hypothetical protein
LNRRDAFLALLGMTASLAVYPQEEKKQPPLEDKDGKVLFRTVEPPRPVAYTWLLGELKEFRVTRTMWDGTTAKDETIVIPIDDIWNALKGDATHANHEMDSFDFPSAHRRRVLGPEEADGSITWVPID